jgi:hypothetical protein
MWVPEGSEYEDCEWAVPVTRSPRWLLLEVDEEE